MCHSPAPPLQDFKFTSRGTLKKFWYTYLPYFLSQWKSCPKPRVSWWMSSTGHLSFSLPPLMGPLRSSLDHQRIPRDRNHYWSLAQFYLKFELLFLSVLFVATCPPLFTPGILIAPVTELICLIYISGWSLIFKIRQPGDELSVNEQILQLIISSCPCSFVGREASDIF